MAQNSRNFREISGEECEIKPAKFPKFGAKLRKWPSCRSPRAGGGDGDDEMGDDGEYDDDAALVGDGMGWGDEEGW